jgi:hypothetical protein
MSVRTLIQEAMNKNALGFEETLREELRNRISLALEAKMKNDKEEEEYGEEESDDTVKESAQLDEISGAKLGSYIVKSRADVAARGERGEEIRQRIIKQYPELKGMGRPVDRKTWTRPKFQKLAVKKLTGDARVPASEK